MPKPNTKGMRPVFVENHFTPEDRDLLISLREGMKVLNRAVDDLRSAYRTDDLVRASEFKEWRTDYELETKAWRGKAETQIDDLQKFRWWILGAAGAASVAAHFLFKF